MIRFDPKNFKAYIKRFSYHNLKKDFCDIAKNVSKKDVLLILILPILATFLMLLPDNIREQLKLNVHNPSWWQFLTSSFIHQDFTHLSSNVSLFLLLGFVQIMLIAKLGKQKRYFYLLYFTSVTFPILSSIVVSTWYPKLVPNILSSSGMSGIVSAMLGFLPTFWVIALSKIRNTKLLDVNFFNIILTYVATSLVFIYYPYHKNTLLLVGLPLLMAVFVFLYRKKIVEIAKGTIIQSKGNVIIYLLLLFYPIFFFVAPNGLFPTQLIQNGSFVDFLVHYFGIFYGFSVSFFFFRKE